MKNIKSTLFLKYCFVGITGTLIDIATVFLLVEFLNFNPILAAVFGFLIAVINNFILNKNWTFETKYKNNKKLFIKFFIVSIVGLLFTTVLMFLFWSVFKIYYLLAKLMTSFFVLFWNFLANKLWTFNIKKKNIIKQKKFDYDLSIIIPAFNEEARLPKTLGIINDFFKNENVEIIVVNDGSRDGTKKMSALNFEKNHGKGFAVRKGVEKAKGKYILVCDADNSTPIEEYEKLKKHIEKNEIVIGSRYKKNKSVKREQVFFRVLIGRIGNFLIQVFVLEGINDTQCGFKLFQNLAAKEIFVRQKMNRFSFDIETLAIAKSLNYKIKETPVSWFHSEGSRVRPIRDSLRTFFDLFYIKLNLWSGRYF